jgi:hypothetical protein
VGGAAEFDGTLVSVLQNRPSDCELLVLHTQPYDDPYGLGSEVRFIRHDCDQLTGLANIGIEHARGEIVHLLGCGLQAVEGWTSPALAHFDDPEVATVSPVVLAEDGQRVRSAGVRWTLGGARQVVADQRVLLPGAGRLRAKILGPLLTAGFYRRDVLLALGGFEQGLSEDAADVAAALAIDELGRLQVCEPASQLLVGEMPAAAGRGFTASRGAERLFWRYARERGLPLSLGFHAASVLADVLIQAPRLSAITALLGRAAALCEWSATQRHQQRMSNAAAQLESLAAQRAVIRLPAASEKAATPEPAVRRKKAA